jgi:hypothetical protein
LFVAIPQGAAQFSMLVIWNRTPDEPEAFKPDPFYKQTVAE